MKKIRIGTRGSQLALWQAHWIQARIRDNFPSTAVEIIKIKTTGDRIVDRPLAMVGGKGLFVKEIENQLLDNEIDLAVHSMKDMPGELPEGLVIGAVPVRENPFDVLISAGDLPLSKLRPGAKIGTSSLRRASQLKYARTDIETASIRGNLDTRIKKLAAGEFDAIVLAAAGLIRLGLKEKISQYLDESVMLPAVGQGALCIETRVGDGPVQPYLDYLNHEATNTVVSGERAFLKRLEGSCHIPVACFGKLTNNRLHLAGLVAAEDGETVIKEELIADINSPEKAGVELADLLLKKGGKSILENLSV